MDDVREMIGQLRAKGWTLAAMADELEVDAYSMLRWETGQRSPANAAGVKTMLRQLMARRRIPKRKRYTKKPPARES